MSYDSQTAIANRHDFDTTYTNEYDSNQDGTVVITPTLGKVLKITSVKVQIEGSASSGSIRLHFVTSANTIAEYYAGGTEGQDLGNVVIRGAQNEALSLTSTLGADQNFFIQVNYKEE